MKNQMQIKLPAFIILLISGMMLNTNINAQTDSPGINGSLGTVVGCNCTKPGYGCFGGQMYCLMYCRYKCHHVSIGMDEDIPPNESLSTFSSNSTTVSFFIEKAGKVSLNIYDMSGRLVNTLTDKLFEEGEHDVLWNYKNQNGKVLLPGIYSLHMDTENFSETEKLILSN
jgi:hypothetical protein